MNKTEIKIKHYGNELELKLDQDADINETLDVMISIMSWMTFDYKMIIDAMKDKADETYRRFNSEESDSEI